MGYIVYNQFPHKNSGTFQFLYYCKCILIIIDYRPFYSNFFGGETDLQLALNGHKVDSKNKIFTCMGPGSSPQIHDSQKSQVYCLSSLLFFCSLQLSGWRGLEKTPDASSLYVLFFVVVADSKTAMFVETIGRIQTLIQRSNM